jgi:hypothetical protein
MHACMQTLHITAIRLPPWQLMHLLADALLMVHWTGSHFKFAIRQQCHDYIFHHLCPQDHRIQWPAAGHGQLDGDTCC